MFDKNVTIFCVAGWEDRFPLGIEKLINQYQGIKRAVILRFEEYLDRTEDNYQRVVKSCEAKNITTAVLPLPFRNPLAAWQQLYSFMTENIKQGDQIGLDISTMPRETIWIILYFLDFIGARILLIYHRPVEYNQAWRSIDPGQPRLVFKMAGITKVECANKLLVVPGYDIERVRPLINFFEPKETVIIIPTKEGKDAFPSETYKQEFKDFPGIKIFEANFDDGTFGYESIRSEIFADVKNFNYILSSLGSKLAAVSMYKAHKEFPETALAYIPPNDYNSDYSTGIGSTTIGDFENTLCVF